MNGQPSGFQILLCSDHSQAERAELVRAQLYAFNARTASPDGYQPLQLFALTEGEGVAAGLLGGTYWGWLSIDILWVREDLRGTGWGSRLLETAELEAIRRGCRYAHVDTHDFQAPDFYRRHGYTVWGILDDLPPGHQRYYLKKELPGTPPPP